MKFDLTTPCSNCPFRNDVKPYLSVHRAEEISEALLGGKSFTCHKKSHSTGWDKSKEEQHCAGAAILLEKAQLPNQMMRWMERIGMYDHKKLNMKAPVYLTFTDFITSQE